MSNDTKMYIAVLDEVPDFMVPTLVAHSVLGAHLKMHGNSSVYDEWLVSSFKKVVVKVNRREFNKIVSTLVHHVGHENTTLDGEPSCLVVEPVYYTDIPNVLKFARPWTVVGNGVRE